MAYGAKYKFKFEDIHGITYEVRLLENNYYGAATVRPLGAAPVIRMQESGAFRTTSCDLMLECQVDGEFAALYTSDPLQYKIVVYRGTQLVWQGFVATEIYSEPDIAPPYDVKITATDGLGVLKEYDFVPVGVRTIRKHLESFLSSTGLNDSIYCISSIKPHGDTIPNFFDDVQISLDYHDGHSIYEALEDLLKTMRCFVTQWSGQWLIIRETDVTVNSGNNKVPGYVIPVTPSTATYGANITYLAAPVGQMGVVDMWPVGFLTRAVRPAKKSVKVRAEWHLHDAAPDLGSWTGDSGAAGGASGWVLGGNGGVGTIRGDVTIMQFNYDLKVTVKVYRGSVWQNYNGAPYVAISAGFFSVNGTKYYHPDTGWTSTTPPTGEEHSVTKTKTIINPEPPQEITVTIPSPSDTDGGWVYLYVYGHLVNVVGVEAYLDRGKGFEDTIVIDNGARGTGPDISISGGRQVSGDAMNAYWADGIFFSETSSSIIYSFDDADHTDLDYLSLTALNHAKVHAAPRIEITGTVNFPSILPLQPIILKSHGVWALMESYDWNLKEAEINFKAVTIPTATLTVDSETITSIPE